MAKWCGKVGYVSTYEDPNDPGVWIPDVTERKYCGEFVRNSKRTQSAQGTNDNIVLSNEVSIIADPFALDNYQNIKYAEYGGVKWKVTNVEIQRPRLRLTFGEVYNG